MRLRIQAPSGVPAETRTEIERKVRLVLGRHAAGIERAQVTLRQGAGGSPSLCRIRVRLRSGEHLGVNDHGDDPQAAAAVAAWRLARRIQRQRVAAMESFPSSRRIGLR